MAMLLPYTPPIMMSTASNCHAYPLVLTHYWRVDEKAADGTVHAGKIWNFTVEPYAIKLSGDSITATASTTGDAAMSGPEKTIDGSGLNADGQHDLTNSNMWFSEQNDPNPSLQFEFDTVRALDEIRLWNSNTASEGIIGWGVKDATIEYSLDGVDWTVLTDVQFRKATGKLTYSDYDVVAFDGIPVKHVKINIHNNWGGFLASYSVSEVQFMEIPARARTPYPADGSVDVLPDVVASWRAGREADTHDVYVNMDPNAVTDGQSETSSVNSIDMSDFDLQLEDTYYWQVVEVNENNATTAWTGDVWSMTVADCIVVDDFESYTNFTPNRAFQTWHDGLEFSSDPVYFPNGYAGNGTGSGIGYDIWGLTSPYLDGDIMEYAFTIKNSNQSMPVYYGGNSRIDREFDTPQNWAIAGIQTLVINFMGVRGNDAGTLYALINNKRVNYPDSAALSAGVWMQWEIDLTSISTTLSSIQSLQIGIDSSGSGLIYLDDICLYKNAPAVPASTDPGTTDVAVKYTFEGNYNDASGHGLTATVAEGTPMFVQSVTGYGQALSLGGIETFLEAPVGDIIAGNDSMTISCWADFSDGDGAWQRIWDFGSGSGANPYMFLCPRENTAGPIRFAIRSATVGEQVITSSHALPTGWQHVAVVIDSSDMTMKLYVNGTLAAEGTTEVLPSDLGVTTQNYIGKSQYDSDALYEGSVDDLTIYTTALTEGEIRYLAGDN